MAHSANVTEVSDADFDAKVLKGEAPALVKFGGKWCAPCKTLDPIVDAIADASKGEVRVFCVDVDEAPEITKRYGVRGVPTTISFANGAEKKRVVGAVKRDVLLSLLK